MVDRRNAPVEDIIRLQLQSEEEFTDQHSKLLSLSKVIEENIWGIGQIGNLR